MIQRRTRVIGILLVSIATIRKNIGFYCCELGRNAHGFCTNWIGPMTRNHHIIHHAQRAKNLRTLFLWHKDMVLLGSQPVIVVENDYQLIAKRARTFKQPHMPDMNRVETTGDRNNNRLMLAGLPHMLIID